MGIGFYHDSQVCTECKACQIACKDVKGLPVGVNYRKVSAYEGGEFPKPWVLYISMACNHCDLPACLASCPDGAITKDPDGAVIINEEMCIGCKSCIEACPYSAPSFDDATGMVGKCDSCAELREQGQNPVCVDACIMRALEFGEIEELKAKHSGSTVTSDLPMLPDSSQTTPNFIANAKEQALEGNYRTFDVM